MSKEVTVNRNYKDTVFRMLFSDRKNLLSLYNAMAGTRHQNPEELQIVTLENAVYMGMKNDIAFILDMGLYLYEHEAGWDKGWKDGQREGWDKGRQDGQREDLSHGANGIIAMGREFQLADDKILKQLQNKLRISEAAARRYLKGEKTV